MLEISSPGGGNFSLSLSVGLHLFISSRLVTCQLSVGKHLSAATKTLSWSLLVCQDFTKTSFSCENSGPALWRSQSQLRLHLKCDIHRSHNSMIVSVRPPGGSEEPPQDRGKLIHQSNVNFFTKICCLNQSWIESWSWRGSYVFSQWDSLTVVTVLCPYKQNQYFCGFKIFSFVTDRPQTEQTDIIS